MAALSFAPMANGQSTGTISGTVRDVTGTVIVGAKVTIRDSDHGTLVRTLTTNSAGVYTAPELITSTYQVTVEMAGFNKAQVDGIGLHVHDQLSIDATLVIGNVQETVSVTAPTAEVETESSTEATLINSSQILDLPLSTRDYSGLTGIQPGVSSAAGTAGGTDISINGQRSSANNWTVDGADNVDRGSNTAILVTPSIDSISEFKTLRDAYSAEYGRSASGQIDAVTKSGTAKLHGSAYEFFRNDILDGNNYFNNLAAVARPPLRYNDFGFTAGGPVLMPHGYNKNRDKTFFFYSQEFHRIVNYASELATGDPTASELTGIFPNPVCVAWVANYSQCAYSTTNLNSVAAINSMSAKYIKDIFNKIPRPNSKTDPNGLYFTARQTTQSNQEIVRIDHNFTPNLSTFFKLENDAIHVLNPNGFEGPTAAFPGVNTTQDQYPGRQIVARVTWSASPTLLIDLGYAYSYGGIHSLPSGLMANANSPDIANALNLPYPSMLDRVPKLTFTGGTTLDSFGPYNDYNYNHNVTLNVSKLLGRHSLRAGVTYFHYEKTENLASYNEGVFDFGALPTPSGSATTQFEQAFVQFLAGQANDFYQAQKDPTAAIITNQAESYIQDDWKVRPRLTLNGGVRYSWFQQPIDGGHELTNFYAANYSASHAPTLNQDGSMCLTGTACDSGKVPNSSYSEINGIIVNNQNSPWGSRVGAQAWLHFAPRVGFSWDVFGNGKTAVRGGYGIAFDSTLFGIYEANVFANPPFSKIYIEAAPLLSAPNGSGATVVNTTPPTLRVTPTQKDSPYSQQFSLGIQHQIEKDLIAEVSYVGTTGTHLIGTVDLNQPKPGAYENLSVTIGGVTYNLPVDSINSANYPILSRARPYQGYGPMNAIEPWFTSNYHSLQSRIQKRFADGSLFDANYTYSHNLTSNQADRDIAIQNLYDIKADYGRAAFDRRHVFSADFVYALPVYRAAHGFPAVALGGWQVGGMVFLNSGLPSTALGFIADATLVSMDPAGLDLLNSQSPAQRSMRPDQKSNPNANAKHKVNSWFNPSAFGNVPAGVARPGNEHVGSINGPRFLRCDLALYKTFILKDGIKLQLRGESVNAFNHTNFSALDTIAYDPSFSAAIGAADARVAQVSARISF
jgi:hypothetical protein